jgi:hypothetical protein
LELYDYIENEDYIQKRDTLNKNIIKAEKHYEQIGSI